ncbi:hypothetical protein [Bacillus sp. FJAT-49736]|nr:hypothetical protein [Bacillus sp. FJAT-49736]
MKNRTKKIRKKRAALKDYLKDSLKNWKPKTGKAPLSNSKKLIS